MLKFVAMTLAVCSASSAMAQVATSSTAVTLSSEPSAVLEPMVQANILRAGTEVALITREELTTKKKQLRVGQRFQMEVSSSVTMNGVIVIPAGTPAIGEITEIRNKGMWGKSGYIGARMVSMRVADRNIRLTGAFDDKGVTGTGGVIAAVALIPLAGFFTTGTSAFIASGSGVKGFLDEDISFRAASAVPKPIEIPAIAPASASVTTAAAAM